MIKPTTGSTNPVDHILVKDITLVLIDCKVVAISAVEVPQLRDPTDLEILATSMAARVDGIVTGDQDLLVLKEFEGILILTPNEFCNRYFPESL